MARRPANQPASQPASQILSIIVRTYFSSESIKKKKKKNHPENIHTFRYGVCLSLRNIVGIIIAGQATLVSCKSTAVHIWAHLCSTKKASAKYEEL